jgi:hypothetical protein
MKLLILLYFYRIWLDGKCDGRLIRKRNFLPSWAPSSIPVLLWSLCCHISPFCFVFCVFDLSLVFKVACISGLSSSFPNSRLITGFVTRLKRRVPLVEQELLTLPEHLSSPSFLISYHLRDIYSICRCCWNVATFKWKVHNGKIEIISLVGNFVLNPPSLSISRYRSKY